MEPRLIESWLPVNEISVEAVREGGALAGHPPVNQLHVWWARRPLIASRAAVAASVLPAGTERSGFIANMGTTPEVVTARREMDAVKSHGGWSDISFPNKRAFLHNPKFIVDGDAPVVVDVTAGGGSIPFEAGRLGLRTIANELNPVACHILRATCEWPQRYGYGLLEDYREASELFQGRVAKLLEEVYPKEPAPDCGSGDCPHPQRWGCVEDCGEPDVCGHAKTGDKKHGTERAHRYVWSYLWARSVPCSSCGIEIPLSPNWRLDDKGTGIRVEPGAEGIALRIVHKRSACSECRSKGKACHLARLYPDRGASEGTVERAIATCPSCGSTTPRGYLAEEARAGRMGHRLYCVIYRDSWRERNRDGSERKRETTCRVFGEPEERHFTSEGFVEGELERLGAQWDEEDALPNEALPRGNKTKDAIYYGMPTWREMFNPRQQLAHGYCVQAFRECVDADREAGRLDDRRKAAWGYVAIAVDKLIGRNSLLCRWDSGTSKVASTFDTHDFGFKWSYAEMIAGGPHGYGLSWAAGDIDECLSELIALAGHVWDRGQLICGTGKRPVALPAEVIQGDARHLGLGDGSVDCVVFDPPYEDNVCYAELSDFFYVWLKRTAGYVFPEHFREYLTEKGQEAIASPVRFEGQTAESGVSARVLARGDYQRKMGEIFRECRRVLKPDGIMTVMFNHKSTGAWDALTVGLIEAGFAITRTWPVKTEAESSLHIRGRAAARTTILLVCRPREERGSPKPWHEVEKLIAREVREDIEGNLRWADLRPIDLYLSAHGPALRVISEHWGTEREAGHPGRPDNPFEVTPLDALEVARRETSGHRAEELSREWASSPVDSWTRFYVLARDATEGDTLEFDEANLLARALGVGLDRSDGTARGLLEFKGDRVRLRSARERLALGTLGWDKPGMLMLDVVHTAVALTDRENSASAKRWLGEWSHDWEGAVFRSTLEALLRTTKPGHDDYESQRMLWRALYGGEAPGYVQGELF